MKTQLNSYFDNWIDKRIVAQPGKLIPHRKSIYILPTKFGFLFGLILTAMLIGSINYEISLGFLLTFLFSGIFFIGMLQSYKNFSSIKLSTLPIKPVFAGEEAIIQFSSLSENIEKNIGINIDGYISYHNLTSKQTISINLTQNQRGIYKPKKIKLFSIYPLGHFYVWSWLKTDLEIMVYPEPMNLVSSKYINKNNKAGDSSSQQKGADELYSYKHYQDSDPINRIAWKKTAQTGKLHSKEMSKLINDNYYIDWDAFPNISTEERLSLMCYLTLQAHNNNEFYGLILPHITLEPDNSEQHKHSCLTELALFNQRNEK